DTANVSEPSVFEKVADPLGFKRAISGAAEAYRTGVTRPAAYAAPAAAPTGAERLRQLKALLDDGLISQAEFEVKRKQLLDEM
ncbi:MAG TPA: SHOCT domain-containing protein, partial [Thermoanaerobaculia bacterium]|nr:SHOCT domain-containing protein [Thermoanaerobaculia bacterium]